MDREKAVAVAKDVVAQLDDPTSTMRPSHGGYFITPFMPDDCNLQERDLRDYLPQIHEAGCRVCALGAAMLSKARLYDDVPASTLVLTGALKVEHALDGIFGRETVDLAEIAYEGHVVRHTQLSTDRIHRAVDFWRKYERPRDRMRAIWQNVIDNNGEFIL